MSRVAPSSRSPAPGPPRLRSATTERRCVHTTCRFAGLVSASALRSVHTPITEQRLEFWRDEELSKPGRCPALRAPQSARATRRVCQTADAVSVLAWRDAFFISQAECTHECVGGMQYTPNTENRCIT